ncbi:MAG: alpha/beta hydrolase, partial [Ignavibacteriaceae bacterium]|nr:alpha/beta hydrolase [Ignavibacteriaceae bacterium]
MLSTKKTKILMILATGTILIIIILFAILLFLSPGKPKPFLNANNNLLENSISEKVFLEINGSLQGLFIKGENSNNPVILYLHGGMPDYFLTEKYPTYLDKNFVMVWWEQRGCGISFNSNQADSNVTLEQLTDDAITLTKYLMNRFNKDKIYLMGHSGGTFLAIHVVDKAPELYHAYIGVAQITDQRESEKLAIQFMLSKSEEINEKKTVEILERVSDFDKGDLPEEYIKIRDIVMHKLGIGTMREMRNLVTDLVLPSLLFREYTIPEKYNLWAGKSKSGISQNWNRIFNTNLRESKTVFKVPVYFFHGIYDYTCSYNLAKEYFKLIEAPVKGFYTFSESAHSPLFEEPEKM